MRPAVRRCAWLVLTLTATLASNAAATWVSIDGLEGGRSLCLESDGRPFTYTVVSDGGEARCTLNGPRRLKFISRYLFTADDPERVRYSVTMLVDGREVLDKKLTGKPFDGVARCRGDGRVASLRRGYIDLPSGRHEVALRVETEGEGAVGVRLFRQVKRVRKTWMPLTPARYGEVRELEFESGNRSSYYHFDTTTPLGFEVGGPTTMRVRTRLDFDHTMNGSQTYTLEVCIDGETWRTFHFDVEALSSAMWLGRPDILPGKREELRIPVPRGQHEVTIHCVRPDDCGVAAMVHIPKRDLDP
ncbi:hypothetical protein GF314_16655 [bacterium]|nr:hypothetical protein [bacterium]